MHCRFVRKAEVWQRNQQGLAIFGKLAKLGLIKMAWPIDAEAARDIPAAQVRAALPRMLAKKS